MVKRLLRIAGGALFYYTGLFHIARFANNIAGRRLTIVTYHRVTDKDIKGIDTSLPYLFASTDIFHQQLKFLRKWYKVITFKDLSAFAKTGRMPKNCLIITFDDGYEDNYYHAYPVLNEMDLPATYFVVSDLVENQDDAVFWWDRAYYYFSRLAHRDDNDLLIRELSPAIARLCDEFKHDPSKLFARLNGWNDEKINALLDILRDRLQINHAVLKQDNRIMSWEQIRSMRTHVHFGSHTCSHSNLVQIEPPQREHEIRESKKMIEKETQQGVGVFSYPCGNIDENLKKKVENAGYEFAVTTKAGVNSLKDRYALKRINVWEGSSLSMQGGFSKGYFAFTLSGV